MLAILTDYVVQVLATLSERAFSRHNDNLRLKRSILSKLLELYNGTEVLLGVCEHISNEFRSYSDGTEAITRVVSAKRLKALHDEFLSFSKAVVATAGVLDIYDPGI